MESKEVPLLLEKVPSSRGIAEAFFSVQRTLYQSTRFPFAEELVSNLSQSFKAGLVEEVLGKKAFEKVKTLRDEVELQGFIEEFCSLLPERGTMIGFQKMVDSLLKGLEGRTEIEFWDDNVDDQVGDNDYGTLPEASDPGKNGLSVLRRSSPVLRVVTGKSDLEFLGGLTEFLRSECPVGVEVAIISDNRKLQDPCGDGRSISSPCHSIPMSVGDVLL